MRYPQPQIATALATLKEHLKPGDTIYMILRHQASSGGSRIISFYTFIKNRPVDLSWSVAVVLALTFDPDKRGLRDRSQPGFLGQAPSDLVEEISKVLFKSGDQLSGGWL